MRYAYYPGCSLHAMGVDYNESTLAVACALGCTARMAPAAANPPVTKVNPKDGAEMVLIPAGEFLMGTSEEELKALLPISEEEATSFRTRSFQLPWNLWIS